MKDVRITGVPVRNRNVEMLADVLAELTPAGVVALVEVEHDDGCPCVVGHRPMAACTCELVNLNVRAVR